MNATVYVYDNTWPCERLRWLRNASKVDYSLTLGDYGRFQFELPVNDDLAQEDLDGKLVGIISDQGAPDFVGKVEAMHEDGTSTLTVIGREWMAVLDDRTTDQATVYSGLAGAAAMDIVRLANARLWAGITPRLTKGGSSLEAPYETRANSVLAALNELSAQTGDEWGRTYVCGQRAECWFAWQRRIGSDLRHVAHIWERSLAEHRYELDRLNEADQVMVVGATGTYAERPSASINTDGTTTGVTYKEERKGAKTAALAQRAIAIDDSAAQDQQSAAAVARAISVAQGTNAETIIISVTGNTDWSWFQIGNVVTARIPRVRLGAGFVTPFRVLGIQPDHETGIIHLVGKVVP